MIRLTRRTNRLETFAGERKKKKKKKKKKKNTGFLWSDYSTQLCMHGFKINF